MHGNKSQRQREQALARFESGAVDTLVATDVAARGLDVSGVSHVINFDRAHGQRDLRSPHRRTGRAGAQGIGITFVAPDQRRDISKLAETLGLDHGLHRTTAGHRLGASPHTSSNATRARRRRNRRAIPSRGNRSLACRRRRGSLDCSFCYR